MPFPDEDSELKNYQIVFATSKEKLEKIVLMIFLQLMQQEKLQ